MLSENVQLELIRAVPTLIVAYFSYKAAQHAKDASIQSKQTEQNTNHLKDELVAEVRKASIQIGRDQEKREAEDRDISYQSGKQSEREGNPTE